MSHAPKLTDMYAKFETERNQLRAEVERLQSDVLTGSSDGVRYWQGRAEAAETLLKRISEWDALFGTVAPYGDGPYWRREIANVLAPGADPE